MLIHSTIPIYKVRSRRTLYKVLQAINARRIAEIGVADGYNFQELCKCRPGLAVAVDTWAWKARQEFWADKTDERGYLKFLDFCIKHPYVLPIRLPSNIACQKFDDEFFDFVYIDARHEYEFVKEDIECWWPKINKYNGILAGHDYDIQAGGVRRAVHEFIENHGLVDRFSVIEERDPTLFRNYKNATRSDQPKQERSSWIIVKSDRFKIRYSKQDDTPYQEFVKSDLIDHLQEKRVSRARTGCEVIRELYDIAEQNNYNEIKEHLSEVYRILKAMNIRLVDLNGDPSWANPGFFVNNPNYENSKKLREKLYC